ncbi:MAG TPA: retropepsin-like aspartic protease [Candidatus Marinimicrobia bacterium]|nr:retropepsin-like aspartic protease [Candidatus Neomarinimicrobiota bacterium]HRS50946.1 retropepsin-like aspartic protease [Candidatus Neomarinimicrobiota bacterium]HRU91712.1 retropepsin-like aspartic protease [Candidatus Neomarinimicrobiota bacterium]
MQKRLLIITCAGLLLASCAVRVGTGNLDIAPVTKPVTIQPLGSDYDNYWAAMQHFDFDYINRQEVRAEYREFTRGLKLLMADDYLAAEPLFMTLFETTSDTLLQRNAAKILWVLYSRQDKWREQIALNARAPRDFDEHNSVNMAIAFAEAQPEKYNFPEQPITLPAKLSISGVPMVEVMVNGVRKQFWIDSGAEITVLSSDIAKECGVDVINPVAARAGTATDIMVNAWPGVIEDFRIGDLQIENHPIAISDKKDLDIKLFKIIRIVKIDGVIGWNIIRNLDMTIDYKNLTVTIAKPQPKPVEQRNFHFVNQPIVSLTDTLGKPLYFFLDTGASATSLYKPILMKIDTTKIKSGNTLVGGLGGIQRYKTKEFPELPVILGQNRLSFKKINARSDGKSGFFYLDGMLGSDIAKNGALILDFQNGRCELQIAK